MVERSSRRSNRLAPDPHRLALPPTGDRWGSVPGPAQAMVARLGALLLVVALAACGGQGNQNVPPAAPAAVSAVPVAAGVRVAWTDQSDNENEFIVYRAEAGGEGEDPELLEIARVPADALMHEDFAVAMGGAYLYAVAATNQAGTSDQVLQDPADPVSPAVGVRLTVTLGGEGRVSVDDGGTTVSCTAECVVGLAAGSTVSLTAEAGSGVAFAGWGGACGGAGTCTFTIEEDVAVEARFSRHVLLLVASGDSPVAAVVSPTDEFGSTECTLAGGQSCAFGYDFDSALKVSVNSTLLESQATFAGYGGACTAPQGRYCLIDVEGETIVEVDVIRVPLAADKAYPAREDTTLTIAADEGLLSGVVDSPGDTHSAVVVAEPASGTLTVAADGSFEYQPAEDANGPVTFQFLARDAHGNDSAPATATLGIVAVNDAPSFAIAGDPASTVGNGVQVTLADFATGLDRGGGADEAGQSLEFVITRTAGPPDLLSAGPGLTINGSTATLTYTPGLGRFGSATYQVSLKDSGGTANGGVDTSEPRSFTITVSPVVLTLSATAGGSLNPAVGTHEYGYGANVNVSATPALDYQFTGWSGACTNATSPCQVTMNGDRTLSASFSPFVRVRGSAFVNVASSPAGISACNPWLGSGVCDAPFAIGTTVTLSISGVRAITGVVCNEGTPTNACTFTVTTPVTVSVD